MNFFPLCTATVCPTNSGAITERRDQVLTTFFSPARLSASILSSRCWSMNGPLRDERPMTPPAPLLRVPALDDELVGRLAPPGLRALGRLAPRRHRVAPAGGLALAAAVRVVDGVHGHAAHVRAPPAPARA